MDLPDALVEEAKRGRLVLLLGAGASIGARSADGRVPPTGARLRDALSDRFLGGKEKDASLAWVAELAISETDLGTVQEFIAEMLRDLQPADCHVKLTSFRWRGIATTNYDTVIESAYECPSRSQNLVPVLSDGDKLDELVRSEKDLALLKLHGCVTRSRDELIPFILTTDQYVTHRTGRANLFASLQSWGRESPIVFVGHAGQDSDLRELLLELSRLASWRPRYYFLKPGVQPVERRLWESKRVGVMDGTFEEFIDALEARIGTAKPASVHAKPTAHPIQRRFVVDEPLNTLLADCLHSDFEYVHAGLDGGAGNPKDFYHGFDFGWYPVIAGLDVRRALTDQLLGDVVIRAEEDRPTIAELYVVRSVAGAGKSAFLRRLAWEAATHANTITLFLRAEGLLRYDALREIHRLTRQRVFLYIDGAAKHAQHIADALTSARHDRVPLTIVATERHAVWNIAAEQLTSSVTEFYEIGYLSHAEIERLVDLLVEHDCLGPNMAGKSREQCVAELEERAGRHLLVALHEATAGAKFDEILIEEYSALKPPEAQALYLLVCTIHRLRVGVRAELVARVLDISFEEFSRRLAAPLEQVVQVTQHQGTQDHLYSARHPEIAQIVFERVLRDPAARLDQYLRIIEELNLAYGTDRSAFRGLLRAKSLLELFPEEEQVRRIFASAQAVAPREAYLFQQQANYERIRPGGDPLRAENLLQTARQLDPKDMSIVYTLAELKRSRAEQSTHRLERERFRNEARSILVPLLRDEQSARYARTKLVKIALDDLHDVLDRPDSTDAEVDNAIRAVEGHLGQAQQESPDEPFLLTADAEFGAMLRENARSYAALRRAFDEKPRDPYIASRLARSVAEGGDIVRAQELLANAIQANRDDRHLHFQYAELLRKSKPSHSVALKYHYGRAFTKWDTNYDAQFWFARYAFESDDPAERAEAKLTFRHLREVPLEQDARVKIRDTIGGATPVRYGGRVASKESTHGFIERDDVGDRIYFARATTAIWERLAIGDHVQFSIGFSFGGPGAVDVVEA